ncbi:MAG TPA: hypothetical protein VFV96_12740 [Verrucomicrobiae bacterium]|nr:hypothetical protein [Verrucomicrobiae bacterium]
MKTLRAALAAVFALWLTGLTVARAVEPAAPGKKAQPARWLLIVDTSSAMERRAKAVEGVVGELVASGMNGQIHPGDELGIWTFNKELRAGAAPLQTWQPAHSNSIAGHLVAFLAKQKYEGKANFQPVLAELGRLVPVSRQLTILVMADGSQPIAGTPFDAAINASYEKTRAELARTRMPLVTVLRVYHGKYIGQNVSFAPWPVEFPPFPPEPPVTESRPTTAAPPAVPPITATAKPIIIHSEPKPAESTNLITAPLAPAPSLPLVTTQPAPVVTVAPAPAAQPVVEAPAAPPAVSPPVVQPLAEPMTPPVAPAPTATPSAAAPVAPSPAVAVAPEAVPTAPTATADTVTARKWPLILGIGCFWVAIMVALVLARRARRQAGTSYITRSIDREMK